MPFVVSWWLYRDKYQQAFIVMMATMLVDLDHLLATPIYDPLRCSIGFHPLHQWPAILLYGAMLAFKPTRIIAIGLLIHMALDSIDCQVNVGVWYQ